MPKVELKVEEKKEGFDVGTMKQYHNSIHINSGLLLSKCLNGRVRSPIKLDTEVKEEAASLFIFLLPCFRALLDFTGVR